MSRCAPLPFTAPIISIDADILAVDRVVQRVSTRRSLVSFNADPISTSGGRIAQAAGQNYFRRQPTAEASHEGSLRFERVRRIEAAQGNAMKSARVIDTKIQVMKNRSRIRMKVGFDGHGHGAGNPIVSMSL